jgi:hypothetical protein
MKDLMKTFGFTIVEPMHTTLCQPLAASDENVDEDIWIFDSGASAHYFILSDRMFNIQDID